MFKKSNSTQSISFRSIFYYALKIFKILHNNKPLTFYFILLSSVILGVIPPLSLISMQRIIGLLEQSNNNIHNVLGAIAVYLLLDLISEIVENIQNYTIFKYKTQITMSIKAMVLNKSIRLSLGQFENSETYDCIQRAKNQNGDMVFAYFSNFLMIFRSLVSVISFIAIILLWSWIVIIPVIVFSIVKSIVTFKMNNKQYKIIRERTDKEREKWYYEFILTNDIAFKEIKLHHVGNVFVKKYIEIYSKLFSQDKYLNKKFSINNTILSIIDIFISSVVFVLVILDSLSGIISIANTIMYIKSFTSIKSNIQGIMIQATSIYRDTLYISELFEFLDLPEEGLNYEGKQISKIDSIEIIDLSYKYPNSSRFALKNINLHINRGQIYAIMGKNGSGKSTLVKLLSGYYEDYLGTIRINGVDLKNINKESYRQQISVFFQDYTKFEFTVRENICLGISSHDSKEYTIKKLLQSLGINKEKYQNLNKRLGFWFPDGIQISGGEWAKIIIARVFMKEASLNIFDEPNASLDAESEKIAFSKMKKKSKNSIIVVITHKMASLKRYANNMIVLHEGEIVAKGNHKELTNCLYYKNLLQEELREDAIV